MRPVASGHTARPLYAPLASKPQKKLLIMTDWFCPGFKAGGIISACYNLTILLKNDYQVYILTTDRDLGDHQPYDNIHTNQWVPFCTNVYVRYTSPDKMGWRNVLQQVKYVSPDYIYMNSMYSVQFTLTPLLQKKIGLIKAPLILSPSGMLKESALQQKALKKKVFLKIFRLLKMQKGLSFHACDEAEKEDIRRVMGNDVKIDQVFNAPPELDENIILPIKKKGSVKLVFSGRIHPIKNLHFLIECLTEMKQAVDLTIIGPVEDLSYYEQCKQLTSYLPANIRVTFLGGVPSTRMKVHLKENHFLVHPSLGENYCYSIAEALCAARPVIISNETPWHNMEVHNAGWDLSIKDHNSFVYTIAKVADMEQGEYNKWAMGAWNLARLSLQPGDCREEYSTMFSHCG